jgi:hypothetical protein
MTDTEAETLGRRLVACKGFRVMRGMLDMQGRTWGRDLLWRWRNDLDVPDLRDPATLGCLLTLVRGAWCDTRLSCVPWRLGWSVMRVWQNESHGTVSAGDTEAEALVAALEAAP